MCPEDQVVIFAQQKRDMRDAECVLNQLANPAQQLFQLEYRSGLLGDGVDGLQLPRPLLLQRIQTGVLQGY